jgi:uncharacterized protein
MQKVKLPVEIDPFKTAKRKLDYEGFLEIKRLPRFSDATLKVNSDVDVWLRFGTDPQGLVVVQGKALAEVELECQRCSETFSYAIDVEFTYSPVCDESQVEELPEDYEPLQLNEDNYFLVAELIEDELLLALPIIPKHPIEDCKVQLNEQVFGEIDVVEEESKPNPFAVLQSLKKKD